MKHQIAISLFIVSLIIYQSRGQSVDPLTGRLQMSIPIGNLAVNDISIPISIGHHGGGIGVEEGNGDCGAGWGLITGGSVSRQVRGLPDELNTSTKKGWLFRPNLMNVQFIIPDADDNLATCADEAYDWIDIENSHFNYSYDTEPDLFFVNAPGLSLQFIFGNDLQPKLLQAQDVVIDFQPISTPNSIIITSNVGLRYTFANSGFVNRIGVVNNANLDMNTDCKFYNETITFKPEWKLSSITSIVTGTTATFSYEGYGNNPWRQSKRFMGIDSTNFLIDRYSDIRLKTITLKSFSASFNWSNEKLSSITLVESNSLDAKKFDFKYTYNGIGKVLLKQINENGYECLAPLIHEFEYYDLPEEAGSLNNLLIRTKSWGQDFYGLINDIAGNQNDPTLYFTNSEIDGRRLRTAPIPGVSSTVLAGDNRTPTTKALFGALRKVKSPNGGFTQIEYELNTYMDNSLSPPLETVGKGIRVKKLVSNGGEAAFGKSVDIISPYRDITKEYEYKLASGSNSSGLILNPVYLGYILPAGVRKMIAPIGDEPSVLYSRVKETVPGKGYTLYEYSLPAMFPAVAPSGEWKPTKSRIARKPQPSGCLSAGVVKNGFYLFPYPPATNYDFKRGLVSKVSSYSPTNTLLSERSVSYLSASQNSTTVKGLRFEKIQDIYYYGIYEIITGRIELVSQEIVKEASFEDPTKLYETTTQYAYTPNLMLESVTTLSPNATSVTKSFKYAKDFPFTAPPANDTTAVAIKALNDSGRSATLIEEVTRTTVPGSATVVSNATIYLYRNFGSNQILPNYIKTLPPGASFTTATMSGQTFIPSPNYRLARNHKQYDSEGRLLTQLDDFKNTTATHYSLGTSLPVAKFYSARAEECVFEGFESPSSFGLTQAVAGFQNATGWTGQNAITFLNSVATLSSSSTQLIKKNGNKYRVSCWVYSPLGKTITFRAKVGSSIISSLVLTNTENNKWKYLEGELNTSAITSTFYIEIVTNAATGSTVTVDDVLCLPTQARVNLQTALPFKGVTSITDDRGNSSKSTYDYLGRFVNSLDRNRNLIQRNEYSYKNFPNQTPRPEFTSSDQHLLVTDPVTFTPSAWNCDPSISYSWQINDVAYPSGPGGVLNHTFTTPGRYDVKLTATSSIYGSGENAQTFCVQHQFVNAPMSYIVTDALGQPAELTLDCNSGQRIVYIDVPAPPPGCYYTYSTTKNGEPYGGGAGFTFFGYSPSEIVTDDYTVTATLDCSAYNECPASSIYNYSSSASFSVSYIPNPNCQ
jgi:hypothetical protein